MPRNTSDTVESILANQTEIDRRRAQGEGAYEKETLRNKVALGKQIIKARASGDLSRTALAKLLNVSYFALYRAEEPSRVTVTPTLDTQLRYLEGAKSAAEAAIQMRPLVRFRRATRGRPSRR